MVTFLTLVVALLGIIALIKMARATDLANELRGQKMEDISQSEIRGNANMMLIFMVSLFTFFAWLIYEYGDKLLPPSASVHGDEMDWLLNFNMIIIIIVFIIMHILLFYFSWKYRYNPNRRADYFPHSNKLELIWTIVPSLFLAVIIFFGLKLWNEFMDTSPKENELVIELYSKQFDWTARYAGDDNLLGEANVRNIEGANFLGIDLKDNNGNDDVIVKGEFHLPVNRPVKFVFRSQDVIHSAYMPHFRAQMNTLPGMQTYFSMIPKTTSAEMKEIVGNPEFEYILLCNKICGSSHYNMQMNIIVESEEDFNKWMSENETFGMAKPQMGEAAEVKSEVETSEIESEIL